MASAKRLAAVLAVPAILLALGMALAAQADTYEGTRPDPSGTPTKIRLDVFVIDIDEINSADQSFVCNVALQATWNDPRLAQESAPMRLKPLSEVWNPELQILNQQRIWATMPGKVTIDSNGTVTYTQRYFGKFSNPLNLRSFPFDRHRFTISFVASLSIPAEVQFVAPDEMSISGMSKNLSVPDWKIIGWSAKPKDWEVVPGALSRPGFEFEFQAKRHAGYFILKVFVPLIMIVMMSWLVFWLNPSEAGTQISVAITSMLTLIAYRFLLGSLLPPVSYMTQMDYFILGSTALVFTAFIESAITVRLAATERETLASEIDAWCRWIFPIAFAGLLAAVLIF